MTVEEFREQQQDLRCADCRVRGVLLIERNANNNAMQVICPSCGSRKPLGMVVNLKQGTKRRRKDYPDGDSLDEVWTRFDDRCVVCSTPKHLLLTLGIGRQRQHVLPYAKFGHQGALVPMCTPCHENATQRQKLMWFFLRQFGLNVDEQIPASGDGLPGDGVSPDPVPAEGQTPARQLETVPDDNADD